MLNLFFQSKSLFNWLIRHTVVMLFKQWFRLLEDFKKKKLSGTQQNDTLKRLLCFQGYQVILAENNFTCMLRLKKIFQNSERLLCWCLSQMHVDVCIDV